MLQLLVLACILALGVAEPESEPATAAAAEPIFIHRDDYDRLDHRHGLDERHDHRRDRDDDHYESRKAHVSHDALRKQHKIIEDVYSPDYYEPTLILDYRYLKSGGRDYTRGPGGQILILPRGVHTHEHKEHKDYDSLIEFLRLRHLAQTEAKKQRHEDEELVHSRHHDFEDERGRGHGVEERWG